MGCPSTYAEVGRLAVDTEEASTVDCAVRGAMSAEVTADVGSLKNWPKSGLFRSTTHKSWPTKLSDSEASVTVASPVRRKGERTSGGSLDRQRKQQADPPEEEGRLTRTTLAADMQLVMLGALGAYVVSEVQVTVNRDFSEVLQSVSQQQLLSQADAVRLHKHVPNPTTSTVRAVGVCGTAAGATKSEGQPHARARTRGCGGKS